MVEGGQFRDGSGKCVTVMPSRKTMTTRNRKLPKAGPRSRFMEKYKPGQMDKHGLLDGRTRGSPLAIARSDRIRKRYEGGDKTFVTEVPNASFCFDGELTRMGFMHPDDVSAYARLLNERGLNLGHETGPADFVVVDQVQGPLDQCEWLKFFRIRKEASSTRSPSWRNSCHGVTQKP